MCDDEMHGRIVGDAQQTHKLGDKRRVLPATPDVRVQPTEGRREARLPTVGCNAWFDGSLAFMLVFDRRMLLVRSDAETPKQS